MKTTYVTSDDKEFLDIDLAARHEAMLHAKGIYDEARRGYARALAETNLTADGVPFDLTVSHTYYYIHPGYHPNGEPSMSRVEFYHRNCDLDDDDTAVILQAGVGDRRIDYRIAELYYHRRNAEAALFQRRFDWLTETVQRYAKMGVTLMGGGEDA